MARIPQRLVLIEWVDASRLCDGWMDMKDIPQTYPRRCLTVGYVLSENEYGKVIVPTIRDVEHRENSHTYGGMMIPTSAIISERQLK